MHIEITKTLISDDDKEFQIGSDISFQIFNKKKNCLDSVICRIIEFGEFPDDDNGYIIADRIEKNRKNKKSPKVFYFSDMKNIDYVYYD